MTRKAKTTKASLKTCYGSKYGDQFILSPVKHIPFMALTPARVEPSKEAAESAMLEHGYRIEWEAGA